MANPPVVLGSTVWVVSSYSDARVVLLGFDAGTLAQVSSVTVPAIGQLSTAAQGVLAAGPDGNLYVAAGELVAVVNPANGLIVQRVQQPAGPVSSVAVAPVGATIYVTTFNASSQTLQLMTYSLTEGGVETGSSTVRSGGGGNLVATSGGVWGTLGSGMSESVWFAPGGDLSSASPYDRDAGGGGYLTLPTLANGAIWIGGTHTLECADAGTGSPLASAADPGRPRRSGVLRQRGLRRRPGLLLLQRQPVPDPGHRRTHPTRRLHPLRPGAGRTPCPARASLPGPSATRSPVRHPPRPMAAAG